MYFVPPELFKIRGGQKIKKIVVEDLLKSQFDFSVKLSVTRKWLYIFFFKVVFSS